MKSRSLVWIVIILLLICVSGCSKSEWKAEAIKDFPTSSLDGLIDQSDIMFDANQTADENGSFKIETAEPRVVHLYEIPNPGIENAKIVYMARIRSVGLEGKAFLEMWCRFPGKGEFFSRSLQSTISGDSNWMSAQTPFFLQKGEKPDLIKLNLVIQGKGTVWIDDIKLMKLPLH